MRMNDKFVMLYKFEKNHIIKLESLYGPTPALNPMKSSEERVGKFLILKAKSTRFHVAQQVWGWSYAKIDQSLVSIQLF